MASDFLADVRRQAAMGLGRDRQDVFEWAEIGEGENEVLRVTYASPRLLAVTVFCSGDPLTPSLDDSPRVTIQAGTDRGTIRFTVPIGVSRLLQQISPYANDRGADMTLYPPQYYVNGQSANEANPIRVYTPVEPIQIAAQSLRVTVQKPPRLAGVSVPRVYAAAIVAPVFPDVSEAYLGRMLEMMARFTGEA